MNCLEMKVSINQQRREDQNDDDGKSELLYIFQHHDDTGESVDSALQEVAAISNAEMAHTVT